ncbi:MAG: DNA mismatch repair endonuclease MutL [Acutalibacter sp.]|jgi:DNA mismatch repair protein MutL|nr:DNA mismatch repair endonuclease MutL [Acutalibacter sp.]
MPEIQVLNRQVAELIAAGEVVERPSSVIKELVENAIDAGSAVVTVETQRGGRTYMRVTDNGCGIPPEQVPTAFLRHATSKIVTEADLDAIGTLGFRGEALAAISAVSRIEMLTRTKDAELGLRYSCLDGLHPETEEAGCPQGTTITVRDLFFNTPARMKFLKKDVTEGNAIAGILDKIALSHPEISFRYIRDGKEVLHTPGDGKLSSALYAVYGKEFSASLIPVSYNLQGVGVKGFISRPAASRANRSMQNFFINGRYIRSRTASVALEEACKGAVMAGKFPACALHLELGKETVDVNVHPAKMEVRFANEQPVFDAVYYGVKSALREGDSPKVMGLNQPHSYQAPPQKVIPITSISPLGGLETEPGRPLFLKDSAPEQPVPAETPTVQTETKEPSSVQTEPEAPPSLLPEPEPEISVPRLSRAYGDGKLPAVKREPEGFTPLVENALEKRPGAEPPKTEAAPLPLPEIPPEESPRPVSAPLSPEAAQTEEQGEAPSLLGERAFHGKIIGEAFGTYILVEHSPQALMLIDKHAAHERLIYERLKAQGPNGEAQALLEPVPVSLEKEEYSAVTANLSRLREAGFEVEDFGPGTVLVRAVPLLLDGGDGAAALMEIAGYLAQQKATLTTQHMDWVYHNVACRAAIKAGDVTHPEELAALCRQLEENPQVRYCPHGRPVYVLLPRREIEKQFGRV